MKKRRMILDIVDRKMMLSPEHEPARGLMCDIIIFYDNVDINRISQGRNTGWEWGELDFNNNSLNSLSPDSKAIFGFPNFEGYKKNPTATLNMEEFYYYMKLAFCILSNEFECTDEEIEAFKQGLAHIHKICEIKDIYEDRIKKYCEENEIEETI